MLTPLPVASHPYQKGFWSSCAKGFRTSGHPQRDVTRLSLLCGPYQGMSRLGPTWFGTLTQGQGTSFEAHLREGQCVRLFGVVEPKLSSLLITVLAPSGALVGRAQSVQGFFLVNPNGALCVSETGAYRVRVFARHGAGLVAVETWALPASPNRPPLTRRP